jgi:phospholipase/lecithinase/hemolysin
MCSAIMERLDCRRLLSTTTVGIGCLGDSYTDEYEFYPPDRSTARNWVEQLAKDRDLNFGAFTTGDRGSPRYQGYAYNWALSGATSTDMVHDELPGLLTQVKSHEVGVVCMFIGGNDFNALLTSSNPLSTLSSIQTTVFANIRKAAREIIAASGSVHLVIANLPDISLLPQGRAAESLGVPSYLLNYVDNTEHAINTEIDSLAASQPRTIVADFSGMANSLLSGDSFKVDKVSINVPTDGDVPTDAFLADNVHPGTVVQGEIANMFVRNIDSVAGLDIAQLSPKQILDAAGI